MCSSGSSAFSSRGEVDIERAFHLGGQARLHAELRRPKLHGLAGAPDDLVEGKKVALLLAEVAAEGAEAAALDADVGEVDVPVDHVGDAVAVRPAPQLVGGGHQSEERRAVRLEETRALRRAHLAASERLVEGPRNVEGHAVEERFQPRPQMR